MAIWHENLNVKYTKPHCDITFQIGSDAVMSWPNAQGVYEVKDMILKGKTSSMVVEDASQDVTNTQASYENGWLTMKFTRKQDTGDDEVCNLR